jgi:hypothetical protein
MAATIQVFDPATCGPGDACGVQRDPEALRFAAALAHLRKQGVMVTRANLALDRAAFSANPVVVAEIKKDPRVLPLVLIDGEVVSRKEYPSLESLTNWCSL